MPRKEITITHRVKERKHYGRKGLQIRSAYTINYVITPNRKWANTRIIGGEKFVFNSVYNTKNEANSAAQQIRTNYNHFARVIPSKTKGFAVYYRQQVIGYSFEEKTDKEDDWL